MADAMRATLSEAERRAFAGFVPAVFHFKASGIVAFYLYPVFRLREHGSGPSYEHPSVAENDTLFRDVVKVWGMLVNDGLVLQPRQNADEPLFAVGQCMQYGKLWAWRPAAVECDFKTSPTELYEQYHKILAWRDFE